MTTNQKIAALLMEQTYAERMEMAGWIRDVANDWLADHFANPDSLITQDDVATWFEGVAESFAEDDDEPEESQ